MQNKLLLPEETTDTRPAITTALTKGVSRLLRHAGYATLAEFILPAGRRVDVAGLNHKGELFFVEIKSCREDFVVDQKWHEYLGFCDHFAFATAGDFPHDILPAEEGLILADGFGGEFMRPATHRPLAAARRKAMTIKFARQASSRLHQVATEPGPEKI